MSFCCCEIHKASFCKQIDSAAVFHYIFFAVGSDFDGGFTDLIQFGDIDLTIIVSGVADHGAVFHGFKVVFDENVFHAGGSNKDIADFGCFIHGHDPVAFKGGFKCCSGFHFGADYACAKTFCPHGAAFAAMSITGHNEIFTGDQD